MASNRFSLTGHSFLSLAVPAASSALVLSGGAGDLLIVVFLRFAEVTIELPEDADELLGRERSSIKLVEPVFEIVDVGLQLVGAVAGLAFSGSAATDVQPSEARRASSG